MYINVTSNNSATSLSNSLASGIWVVLYYADWCGHCTTMKPEWNKFIKHIQSSKDNNNLNTADVNSDYVNDLTHKPTIEGYPTITMYNNGVEVAKFNDERKYENIRKFAISNSEMVQQPPHKKTKLNTTTNTNTIDSLMNEVINADTLFDNNNNVNNPNTINNINTLNTLNPLQNSQPINNNLVYINDGDGNGDNKVKHKTRKTRKPSKTRKTRKPSKARKPSKPSKASAKPKSKPYKLKSKTSKKNKKYSK